MSPSLTDHQDALDLFELKDQVYVTVKNLKAWLPDVATLLFFAKVYKLDRDKLSDLLLKVFDQDDVLRVLTEGGHSTELQSYLLETIPELVPVQDDLFDAAATKPAGSILPALWEAAEIKVAQSIQEVADKLTSTLSLMPTKQGHMVFKTMAKMNKMRPTVGAYEARIQHQQVPDVCVILDVSGSMSEPTIQGIIEDVVALSWNANAHLVIVSNRAYHWEPGSYTVEGVLARAEYGGTHYEALVPILNKDWGTVVTIADYDSSLSAKRTLSKCSGVIGKVLDISLVGRTTFLAECVGTRAQEIEPLLLATNLCSSYY